MSYKIEWMNNDLLVSYAGDLNFKDIFNANKEIYSDKRFKNMTFQVVDLRAVTYSSLTTEETKTICNQEVSASIINNNIRIAIVFNNPAIILNSSQTYIDALADTNWHLQGFDDLNKALEWCRS